MQQGYKFSQEIAIEWLNGLKQQSLFSFSKILKLLEQLNNNQDNRHEIFVKMNKILVKHPELTVFINEFMNNGTKFYVEIPLEDKIVFFLQLVSKEGQQLIEKIRQVTSEFSKETRTRSKREIAQNDENVKKSLKQVVKGYPNLQLAAQQLFITTDQAINQLDLEHIKRIPQADQYDDSQKSRKSNQPKISKPKLKKQLKYTKKAKKEAQMRSKASSSASEAFGHQKISKQSRNYKYNKYLSKQKPFVISNKPSIYQQKAVFKSILQNYAQKQYFLDIFAKVLHLYQRAILTQKEVRQIYGEMFNVEPDQPVKQILRPSLQQYIFHSLMKIIESRQKSRRVGSVFKPLQCANFDKQSRITPSYIMTPKHYPTRCSKRSYKIQKIMNSKLISLPVGTQQNFNIRNNNSNEASLLKAEDIHYELDICLYRIKASIKLFKQIIENEGRIDKALETESEQVQSQQLKQNLKTISQQKILTIIDLRTIQLLYKLAQKSEKDQLQWQLRNNTKSTCQMLLRRFTERMKSLQDLKKTQLNEKSVQIYQKNYFKALDVRTFERKKRERQKLKYSVFIKQLQQKQVQLKERLKQIGQDAKEAMLNELLSSFNSFSTISMNQQCDHIQADSFLYTQFQVQFRRSLQNVSTKKQAKQLPLYIFSFDNKEIFAKAYSYSVLYIDTTISSQNERKKLKTFLQCIFAKYMNLKQIMEIQWDGKSYSEQQITRIIQQTIENHEIPTNIKQNQEIIKGWFKIEHKPMYPHRQLTLSLLQIIQKRDLKKEKLKKIGITIQNSEDPSQKQQKFKLDPIQSFPYIGINKLITKRQSNYTPRLIPDKIIHNQQKNSNEMDRTLFVSESCYCFMRFFYSLYERLLKLKQSIQIQEHETSRIKQLIFDALFLNCIKSKDSGVFQSKLDRVFKHNGKLYYGIIKILQNIIKSVSKAVSCPITLFSLKYEPNQFRKNEQQLYLIMINRLLLNMNQTKSNIIRLYFRNESDMSFIFVNNCKSYYQELAHFQAANVMIEFGKNLDLFLTLNDKLVYLPPRMYASYKKRVQKLKQTIQPINKYSKIYQQNNAQYCFDLSNYHLNQINQSNTDDVIVRTQKINNLRKSRSQRRSTNVSNSIASLLELIYLININKQFFI